MAVPSLIAFAVVIAVQVLAGCDMPAKGGEARYDRSAWRKAEFEVRNARLRRQVEAGTFGLAQLFPGGMSVDARHLPPLPPPSSVPMPVVPVAVARSSPSQTPVQVVPAHVVYVALGAAARRSNACVYKPIMSDADIDACR